MRVAVTSAGTDVGRRLVASLVDDPAVDDVLALDRARVAVPVGARAVAADVGDPAVGDDLAGCDVLVHLAVRLDPLGAAPVDARHVEAAATTLRAAVGAGVRRVVVASSAAVYGAHRDNDVPLSESSPRRPERTLPWAWRTGQLEDWLWGWVAGLEQDVVVTVLRPAVVAGPGVDNVVTRMLELPRVLTVAGHRPPVQVVHVDDLVAAFHHAATRDLPGAYNVAAPGWLSQDEALGVLGRRRLDLPEEVAWSLADGLHRAGLADAPASTLAYLLHPWVVDVGRLAATGWAPRHGNREALRAVAAEHGDWLRLGGVRLRRRALRAAAAVAVGSAAAGLLARQVR